MALWKPFRGNRADLDTVEKHDGYVYFCIDDGSLFFDYTDSEGNLQRKQINANEASSLIGYNISSILNDNNTEIPTAKAVADALDQKSQVQLTTIDDLGSITEVLSTLKIYKFTQEQYDKAVENGMLEDGAIYLTPNEETDLSDYVTMEQLDTKANTEHSHDDKYYTEVEVDTLIASKSDASHKHDGEYDTKGSANEALNQAKSYVDNAVSQKSQVQIITWEVDD
jgi:hypothetical protein